MNLKSASFALAILLLGILNHSMINSSFAQTVSVGDKVTTGIPTDTVSNMKSSMQTAKNSSIIGMKMVMDKMKTEKGLKNKLRVTTGTSKDVMRTQMHKVIPSNMTGAREAKDSLKSERQTDIPSKLKLENQIGIQQKKVGNATNHEDEKRKHFEQMRDNLMHSKFKPNPLAKSR